MKKYEMPFVPVNEETTNKFIKIFSYFSHCIECLYMTSYFGDASNTRVENNHPIEFDEYLYLISLVKKYFPIEILMQRNCNEELIKKYYELGFNRFTINDDELAKQIKKQYKDIILTLSITRMLQHIDLFELDLSCYDYIVLDYRYCRQLSLLKELPKKYNYVLLVNSDCSYYNRSVCKTHWFDINNFHGCKRNKEDSSHINPIDLKYFDDYVHHYKLQGREGFPRFLSTNLLGYLYRKEEDLDLK